MSHPTTNRRERLRQEATSEIKQLAMRQLAVAGVAGISMVAIAKEMGMTGPALYRYFANRDALLTALIRDGYADLAHTAEGAAQDAAAQAPGQRLRTVAAAVRGWALQEPQRYLLLFGTPVPGYRAPMDTLEAANRTLRVFALIAAELVDGPTGYPAPPRLQKQFEQLANADHPHCSARALLAATVVWTRIHGQLSLELIGQFTHMRIDPALLFDYELDSTAAQLQTVFAH